ncbi:histidine phosphatase family protein [Microbacterium oxydans]|uniref:histidine phosphatase family protein n=1 Tax=Microbacterium oxydans TaxID=82380 RepID=UPI000A6336C3|nr:histidine phosphatase family protein [Microbacterium oxydans]
MEQLLILARHGQTALNAQGRLRGLADPPLDDEGIAQARALARALQPIAAAAVYCSPLQRAVSTAQVIATDWGIVAASDAAFNDRDYGPWTGELKSSVVDRWGSVDAAPGVEPVKSVLERARPGLDRVLDEHPGRPVVVVTHDAIIRPLLETIDASSAWVSVPTGSWQVLARDAAGWSVRAVDQVPGL